LPLNKKTERDKQGEREMKRLMRFFKDEEGVTAIEYGLIAALIAVVIIIAVAAVGTSLSTTFQNVATHVASAS
jgi:pilus assembly protein Flp/PilA